MYVWFCCCFCIYFVCFRGYKCMHKSNYDVYSLHRNEHISINNMEPLDWGGFWIRIFVCCVINTQNDTNCPIRFCFFFFVLSLLLLLLLYFLLFRIYFYFGRYVNTLSTDDGCDTDTHSRTRWWTICLDLEPPQHNKTVPEYYLYPNEHKKKLVWITDTQSYKHFVHGVV